MFQRKEKKALARVRLALSWTDTETVHNTYASAEKLETWMREVEFEMKVLADFTILGFHVT